MDAKIWSHIELSTMIICVKLSILNIFFICVIMK